MRKSFRDYVAVGVCFALAQASGIGRTPQSGTAPPAAVRPIGVVTQIQPGKLTLHTDGGAELSVDLPDGVTAVRVPPGAKDLKSATPIAVSDINAGDRVFVRGKIGDDQKSMVATTVIVMSRSAIASAHEAERLEWQKRGVGGLVKAVDPATKQITISVPTTPPTPGNPTHPLTISLAPNATLLRYVPDSIKFSDATPGSFEDIKVGDQVRALGTKSADGNSFTAEKVVSGTFRNLAATVISVDSQDGTATVKDLATGKPVLVRTNADSKLHRLPPFVAQAIAILNSGGPGAPGMAGRSAANSSEGGRGDGQGKQAGRQSGWQGGGQAGGQRSGAGSRDFQQMLDHMPPLSLSELKPDDALIVVSTGGTNPAEATAIVLLAGVEPILAARPKGSNQVVLPPWTMGMGGGEGEGGQ
ncbi:MAG TPA: hypothetical protein VG204_14350 [Terriglobia bacterium]|nr:hypothetical protein [Terriglobia bacterium]